MLTLGIPLHTTSTHVADLWFMVQSEDLHGASKSAKIALTEATCLLG